MTPATPALPSAHRRGPGRCAIAGALVALSAAACSDYQQARGDFARGQYEQALAEFKVLAKAGDSRAQYDIAQMYFHGMGTDPDTVEGARWLILAANSGNPAAMVHLGRLYETADDGERDYSQAAQWYHRAARRGDAVGRFNLGLMYLDGKGVPRDRAAALAWFRLAQDAGGLAGKVRADELEATLTAAEKDRAQALGIRFRQERWP
jgi:TPR repeat protein